MTASASLASLLVPLAVSGAVWAVAVWWLGAPVRRARRLKHDGFPPSDKAVARDPID